MSRRVVLVLATVIATVAGAVSVGAGSPATAIGARARPDPVLLVHGFNGSGQGWHALVDMLRARGYRASEIDAIDYPSDISNVAVARQIAREADGLRARTGAARIDVVAHSMGAISSRYYVERLGGAARVDAWVSLAGVNEGTAWAYGCYALVPCREMTPTSSLLDRLASAFHPSGPTRYGAWWSPCDAVIIPPSNAELTGARNVRTPCLGHSELRDDPQVLAEVAEFLKSPARRA